MPYEVEYTDEFRYWWNELSNIEQDRIERSVDRLVCKGWSLDYPHSSKILSSRHSNMRELRIQGSIPLRVFYAFDPRRSAVLLIGGNKAASPRFYATYVPVADRLYDQYLDEIRREGLIS